MIAFILRRLVVSAFVLLAATFLMYLLAANAGDPLADLRELPGEQREAAMAERIERMRLDLPVPARYVLWLGGIVTGDLGTNRVGQSVNVLLADAFTATLQLVVAATVLAIVVGVAAGIISALRQYSGFDHTVTLAAFLAFSLPIFWVATLLKQFAAIELNNWLRDPIIPPLIIGLIAVLAGLVAGGITVTGRRTRLVVFASVAGFTAVLLALLSATGWFAKPGLGPIVVGLSAFGGAVGFTTLIAGLAWHRPMQAALVAGGLGTIVNVAIGPVLWDPSLLTLAGLAALTFVVCAGVGWFVGGELYRRQAIPAAVLTGLFTGGVIFVDRLLLAFPDYRVSVAGRPISTIGSRTPDYEGDFWMLSLDTIGHLALPTLAVVLISLAVYTRYSRASMLEVMNQDYVRTARAKGLTERAVITRHAFRNGLIPVTTLAAYDFGTVISGAVVTETVFGWKAMGRLLLDGIVMGDPNLIMAFFVVAGGGIVMFNMLADIAYAFLDPRIRLS